MLGIVSGAIGQNTINLTFTAVDSTAHIQLYSIKVINRTQGCDTVLYWPDTVLSIYYLNTPEIADLTYGFKVFQNHPNPVAYQTKVSLLVPEKDKVSITVTDNLGRVVIKCERVLDIGIHCFRFTPGSMNLYFFTAGWKGQSSSIKILNSGFHSCGTPTLEYTGSAVNSQLKSMDGIQEFSFNPGDELLYIGYAHTRQSGILDSPEENITYTFQFATNIPCPETPTVEYEGQVYNTIQILSQCWLKENLNAGLMIPGNQDQSNNAILEKHCINDELDSCTKYGGLYMWNEMMQYTLQQGVRGICPPDWHLPTDEELKMLEGAVDSQYGIGDPEWDIFDDWRGYDAGTNLRSTIGWKFGENGTDLFGFSGLPGGFRYTYGLFYNNGTHGYWWTSTELNYGNAWNRNATYYYQKVGRSSDLKGIGYSVRCLRNY